jgi:hypothetical protein
MPSGFMPKGTVVNQGNAASFAGHCTVEPMKASISPFEAALKHSSGGTIWPLGDTTIRKRPPLVSSTTFARCSAAPCRTSSAGVQVVAIRH